LTFAAVAPVSRCSSGYSTNRFVDTYQPISRFSPFQLIESGIFVGLSVMALAVAVWWIPRQTA